MTAVDKIMTWSCYGLFIFSIWMLWQFVGEWKQLYSHKAYERIQSEKSKKSS
jgi:hypothetical protein